MTITTQDPSSLDERIAALVESDPDFVTDPYPVYSELLASEQPYRWGPAAIVSRFDDVKAVLKDSTSFSNRGLAVGSRVESIRANLPPSAVPLFDEVTAFEELFISRSDGDRHDRLRAAAHRAFTPRKMAELAGLTQTFTDELIAEMREAGETDITAALTSRLPIMMICSLLNVPLEDRTMIRGWSAKFGKNRGGAVTADLLAAHEAIQEFRAYVEEIVAHYRKHPESTNLVSALMGAADQDQLSTDELVAMVLILLFAGADTTTALLGNGTHAFMADRHQWELLCASPAEQMGGTLEELLRYVSPIQTLWRVTAQETTIRETRLPAGTTTLIAVGAANRDPDHFSEPDRFDVLRTPNKHIAFGFGAHFCLGASLARMETATVFRTLASRFPDMSMTQDPETVRFGGNIQFRTIDSLTVELGPERKR